MSRASSREIASLGIVGARRGRRSYGSSRKLTSQVRRKRFCDAVRLGTSLRSSTRSCQRASAPLGPLNSPEMILTWHVKHCFSIVAAGVPVPSWQRLHSYLTISALPRSGSPAGSSASAVAVGALEAAAVEAEALGPGLGEGLSLQERASSAMAATGRRERAGVTAPSSVAVERLRK